MQTRFRLYTFAAFIGCPALVGCVSADNLRTHTDKELASCLTVGMSIEAAEKCTQRAELWFTDRNAPPGVRIYKNDSWGNGPMLIAIVYAKLHFNESGQLESWSTDSATDGM